METSTNTLKLTIKDGNVMLTFCTIYNVMDGCSHSSLYYFSHAMSSTPFDLCIQLCPFRHSTLHFSLTFIPYVGCCLNFDVEMKWCHKFFIALYFSTSFCTMPISKRIQTSQCHYIPQSSSKMHCNKILLLLLLLLNIRSTL